MVWTVRGELQLVSRIFRCYHRVMWHSIPLTLFWFVYFGSLGIFYPYFALYLRENAGLTGTEVGLSLAILRDEGRHAFGRVRVWGTIGYFILILVFPWMLAAAQPSAGSTLAVNLAQPGLGL